MMGYYVPLVSNTIETQKIAHLESLVDLPYGIIEKYYNEFNEGRLTEAEAKEASLREISQLRYEDGNYFWINDSNPTMIMHPIKPALNGTSLKTFSDPDGKLLFVEMVKVVQEKGQGTVDYKWERPDSDIPQPKTSYVKGFSEWDWIVGTGVYVDDIVAIQQSIVTRILISTGIIILIGIGLSLLIANAISRPIQHLKNAAKDVVNGNMSVKLDIESLDEIGDLSRAFNDVIKTVTTVIDETHNLDAKIIKGYLDSTAKESTFEGEWKRLISGINSVTKTLEGHIRKVPAVIMAIDKDFNVMYMNDAGLSTLKRTHEQTKGQKCYDLFKTEDCRTDKCACYQAIVTGKNAKSETIARPHGAPVDIQYEGIPLLDHEGNIIGAYELVVDQTTVKNAAREQEKHAQEQLEISHIQQKQAEYQAYEVKKLIQSLEVLANGKLEVISQIAETDKDTLLIGEDFEKIYSSLHEMVESIRSYIEESSNILRLLSNKDLNVNINREYKGDFVTMKNAINEIVVSLNDMLGDLNVSSSEIAAGADQVSASATSLSSASTQQASSIEEITASMTEISDQTRKNAESAKEANMLSSSVRTQAESGTSKMKEMVQAMDSINTSSNQISNIIKVIDEIAFQTNLLALNAAVEAARAGQHGKGFAVVAEEVRNLAARSAKAANETTGLIEDSIKRVQTGTDIALETSKALDTIVDGIVDVSDIVNGIAVASTDQASAINEINQGIHEVSKVTQSNASTAHQSAAASEEMAAQATVLKDIVNEYKTRN